MNKSALALPPVAPADATSDSLADFGLLAATGFGVGVIVGLTGVGGGSIMTPLLITVFGVPAPIAVGTDLACAAVTKTAGTVAHRATHNIKVRVVVLLALGSVPAAIATLAIVALAQLAPQELNRLIKESVGVALILSIAVLLLRGPLRRWGARSQGMQAMGGTARCSPCSWVALSGSPSR